MSQRFRHSLALAALLFAAPLPAVVVADAAFATPAPDAPLLWSGRVVDHLGRPSPAQVTAFLRPPASAIPDAGSGAAAPASIPLVSAVSGRDGRFALRASLPSVPAGYRPDGWLHVMVLAEAADGAFVLANDSVRYIDPTGPLATGAWVSTIAGEEGLLTALAAPRLPSAATLARLITDDLRDGIERPDLLQLGEPRYQAASTGPASRRWKSPGDPYVGCATTGVERRESAFRTISDIDVGPAWSYTLDYTETRTTSWEIGVEQGGGRWKAGGTTSFSANSSRGFNADYGPYPNRFRQAYQVQLIHAKVGWRCASKASPGPFYIHTVEPESWDGGTFNQGELSPREWCTGG